MYCGGVQGNLADDRDGAIVWCNGETIRFCVPAILVTESISKLSIQTIKLRC